MKTNKKLGMDSRLRGNDKQIDRGRRRFFTSLRYVQNDKEDGKLYEGGVR